jgi:hypothetical protein
MARGWESKSIEQQQEEMSERTKTASKPISTADRLRNQKREGLLLCDRLFQHLAMPKVSGCLKLLGEALAGE